MELPSYIRWDIPLASPHRRPVCVLHLRYWCTIISLTRIYLLYNIVHGSRVPGAEERRLLNDLGQKCIDACDQSLKILKVLRSHELLSSLTVYDTKWIIDLAMLSILILIRQQLPQTHQNLKDCVDMLQSMENGDGANGPARNLPRLSQVIICGLLRCTLMPRSDVRRSHRKCSLLVLL